MIKLGDLIKQRKEIGLAPDNIGVDFFGKVNEIRKVIYKDVDIKKFKKEGPNGNYLIDTVFYEIYYEPFLDNISDEQLDFLVDSKKLTGKVEFCFLSKDLENAMGAELL